MATFELLPAQAEDIAHVARNLRPEHIEEIRGTTDLSMEDAVFLSVRDSLVTLAGRGDGQALFLAGASRRRIFDDVGSVWMLATPEIDLYAIPAARALRRAFAQAHTITGAVVIEQWIPSWYAKGIAWLLWLGWRAMGTKTIRGRPHEHMIHEEMGYVD